MNTFVYTYQIRPGHVATGKVKALSATHAKSYLKKRKITVLSLKSDKVSFLEFLFSEKQVKSEDIVAFSQLFASCIKSGLTVKDALTLLSKQVDSKLLKKRLADIMTDIESGQLLSMAFQKHTDIFPPFYPMLIKGGEASGDLGNTLDYIGQYLERIQNLKKELIGIFMYPAIVFTVGMILMSVILSFVAPTFKKVFIQSKSSLPILTKLLFVMSDLFFHFKWAIALVLSVTTMAGVIYYRTPSGKRTIQRQFISIPLIGKVIQETLLLRFLKGFEILLNNGVPILEALKVIEEGTHFLPLSDIIVEMRRDISKGLPLSGPLIEAKKMIPPMISYSLTMGEKSGDLGATLSRLSQFVDREITFSMKRLASRLDPILTVCLGIIVLFIALAIYLPIFDMMGKVR